MEIITCAATHGFLPLMEKHPGSVRAQILIARDEYQKAFGRKPRGIWLPECAYFSGLENYLQEAELRWFSMDAHGLMFGSPRPRYAIYAPCFIPPDPRPLDGIVSPLSKFGVSGRDIPVIQPIATFTATSAMILIWSISVDFYRLTEQEDSPELSITGSPDPLPTRRSTCPDGRRVQRITTLGIS